MTQNPKIIAAKLKATLALISLDPNVPSPSLYRRVEMLGEIARGGLVKATEDAIIDFLLARLLAAGFKIDVNDDGATTVEGSTDFVEIRAALRTTDVEHLFVRHPAGPGPQFITFVYDNCGYDVIHDYSAGPHEDHPFQVVMREVNTMIEAIDETAR